MKDGENARLQLRDDRGVARSHAILALDARHFDRRHFLTGHTHITLVYNIGVDASKKSRNRSEQTFPL